MHSIVYLFETQQKLIENNKRNGKEKKQTYRNQLSYCVSRTGFIFRVKFQSAFPGRGTELISIKVKYTNAFQSWENLNNMQPEAQLENQIKKEKKLNSL